MKWRDQLASVMTLSLETIAQRAPNISFIHTVPGAVESGISRDAEGFSLKLMLLVSRVFLPFIATPPAECGERHTFAATSALYPPGKANSNTLGVDLADEPVVATGSTGKAGSGTYSVGVKNENAPEKVFTQLKQLRDDGTAAKVWEYLTESYLEILGTAELAS